MRMDESLAHPTTRSIAAYVKKRAPDVRKAQRHQHMASESVREADYKNHHITIRTTYAIDVDGVPVTGHIGVTNDGRVHYHAIPNAAFPSAVDLVKQLIDTFPDDFPAGGRSRGHGGMHHAGMGRAPRQPSARARRGRMKRARRK
jgi:hypothetical protein